MAETILHAICFSDLYGVQKCALSIASNLDTSRYRAIVAAPYSETFFRELESAGVETASIPFSGLADTASLRSLRSIIKKENARIIHAHLGISSFISLIAAETSGASVICSRHLLNDRYTSIQNKLVYSIYRNIYTLMNRRFAKTTFPSEATRRAVEAREGSMGDKAVVIPNSIRIADFSLRDTCAAGSIASSLGLNPEYPLAACVSRLSPEKRVEDFARAAAKLKSDGVKMNYIVAGEGPLKASLEVLVSELGLRDCFRLAGYIDSVAPLLAQADIFALCTPEEAFGISVLEAMAAGAPVICPESGGPVEIIENNISGLFFRPLDYEHLAEKMKSLHDDPSLRDSLRNGALKRVALYDDAVIARRYMDLYDETLRRYHG